MKLTTATLSVAGVFALFSPAFGDATGASTFWERQRSEPVKESRPYALTGDSRRANQDEFKTCIGWVGANRERRPVYKRN